MTPTAASPPRSPADQRGWRSSALKPAATQRYVAELDGIRALAVGLVVCAHYGLGFMIPGGFGVTLFFFLSGYLITTLFFAEYRDAGSINIPQFYLRRWLRLTPPLLILIALSVVFFPIVRNEVGGSPVPIGTTLAVMFYYTNYYNMSHHMLPYFVIPFGVCWSLAVEEHFYLAWPLIIRRGIRDPRRLCLLVVGLCAAVVAWRCGARFALGVSADHTYLATDCRIDSILYGALLRVGFETPWSVGMIRFLRAPSVRALAVLALLVTFVVRNDDFRETFRYSVQGLALMPFFTAVLVEEPSSLLRSVLRSAPLVLIGRLSYSIYLFHSVAVTPAEAYFGPQHQWELTISGIVLTGLISYTLFVFVERPIAGLRHRLRARTGAAAGVPTSSKLSEVPVMAFQKEAARGDWGN
jgi:peptidoglycan/LPS O-acetylase OafA/YrhL